MALEYLPHSPKLNEVQVFLYSDLIIRDRLEGIGYRDPLTHDHLIRATFISAWVAEDSKLFSNDEIEEIATAAGIHDIGKDFIGEEIVNKPKQLTEGEWLLMKQHPEAGFKWLQDAMSHEYSPTLLTPEALLMVKYHHGLQKNAYPARINPKNPETDPKDFPKGEARGQFVKKLLVVVAADLADAGFLDRPYHKAKFKGLSEPQLAAERAKLYIQMGETYPGPQFFLDLAIHYAAVARGQIPRGFSRN